MSDSRANDMIRSLQHPGAWPWPVTDVAVVETHISRVLVGGDHAVKLKRHVQYSFVDYSTVEKRYQACLDEVRLNRLLTDDIYLGVVPILRDGPGYRIGTPGEEGEIVDWATLMRRIDDHLLLDHRLDAGDIPPDLASRLADRLLPFHQRRPVWGRDDPDTALRMLVDVVTDNLDELQPFAGNPLPAGELSLVDHAMRSFIDREETLLRGRVRDGWIREGHGDLRCEHVIVPDDGPVHVYDCVEFNPDLRRADVASDLAFLLMDLFRLGAPPQVVTDVLGRYWAAGIDLPASLLRFYWIHRALVRAKVHCLRLSDLDGEQRDNVARKAVDYLHVATRQAITVRPAIVVMSGLSGTGKSTVAHLLARATGADLVASDHIRKELAQSAGERSAAWGEGIYTPEWTARTYARLIDHGREVASSGGLAILDGTFLDRALREQVADVARGVDVPLVIVETVCDADVVERRLAERELQGDSISDAGVAVYREQKRRVGDNPPGVPEGAIHVDVDTSPDGPVSFDTVWEALRAASIIEPEIR